MIYIPNVPNIGNVALSHHAQERAANDNITDQQITDLLWWGEISQDGLTVITVTKDGLRAVIETAPTPNSGACVMLTCFRMRPNKTFFRQAKV